MKLLTPVIFVTLTFLLISCSSTEMEINSYLKENSKKFNVTYDQESQDNFIKIGHFASYDKEFGLAWMESSELSSFLDQKDLYSYSTSNNDNYVYNNIIQKSNDAQKIDSFALSFNLPLDPSHKVGEAFFGYLYAPHDEYSLLYFPDKNKEVCGYLSNGFDLYEIMPVISEYENSSESQKKLMGYQIKLNNEFVGSLQLKDKEIFRMSTEFCDATEIILATIASTIINCKNR